MDRLTIRRKLLRGSLSAPLVLTVTSAGANGSRSTFGACLDRAGDHTASDWERIKDREDFWWRRKLYIKKVTCRGSYGDYFEYYVDAPTAGTCYQLAGDSWPYKLKTGVTNPKSWLNVKTRTSYRSCDDYHKQVDALCFFDGDGREVGWHWAENSGKCISKSCYASVYGHKV